MVPHCTSADEATGSLPRASGDGPFPRIRRAALVSSPPRERGWSLLCARCKAICCVSPARAGMVPKLKKAAGVTGCLPRASGDGPRVCGSCPSALPSPPRERGWSHSLSFPGHPSLVSPARAGMVPRYRIDDCVAPGLPRASGDGPVTGAGAFAVSLSPPRERGWSLPAIVRVNNTIVSPARAGMVRRHVAANAERLGLPRASGDGPRV